MPETAPSAPPHSPPGRLPRPAPGVLVRVDAHTAAGHVMKYSGVAAIPIYIGFALASYLQNPQITPLQYWLSDLGNYVLNPSGAWLYNVGCILAAILLAVFYIGMYRWYRGFTLPKKYLVSYLIAQVGGIAGSIFLVLAAVFTLGTYTPLHSFFSAANMIGMNFFIAFTATAFVMNPHINKGIAIFGFVTVMFNIVTTNAFSALYIAEPVYLVLFMLYVVIVTSQDDRLVQFGKDAFVAEQADE
jgi:hypothetical membrane protein